MLLVDEAESHLSRLGQNPGPVGQNDDLAGLVALAATPARAAGVAGLAGLPLVLGAATG